MKRYLIAAAIAMVVAMLFFLWTRRGARISPSEVSQAAHVQAVAAPAGVGSQESPEPSARAQKGQAKAGSPDAEIERYRREMAAAERIYNQDQNVPVAFYGMVVDQDTNPLPNVSVDLAIIEEHPQPFPTVPIRKTTRLVKETGADGRFEITGLRGTAAEVYSLTKEGYEQDYPGEVCGGYGAQITSFINPAVLRMWSTNIHEPLVTANKSFVIIPDGRHYAIDLINGTIAEGDDGDLVAWIKRPEKVKWGDRYDWSCELAVPTGGLLESQSRDMFIAPEMGYTNGFAREQKADPDLWGDTTGEKRFYVHLRNGKIYGRITVNLQANYFGKQPAMIEISYAINPSGSRLLR